MQNQNIESLYKVMKKFISLTEDEKKIMGLEGRKRMEKFFDKKDVVQDTKEILWRSI